jgi:hypothetical protein
LIAYYRGDDGYGIDHRVSQLAHGLEQATGAAPERWRVQGSETTVAAIGERVATAPMFGGGTLAVVVDPAPLLRSKADRGALEGAIATVAPGNALVFVEISDRGARRSAALQGLESAVARGGGEIRTFKAPQAGELAAWIEGRARERDIQLAPGAARELARRVGGSTGSVKGRSPLVSSTSSPCIDRPIRSPTPMSRHSWQRWFPTPRGQCWMRSPSVERPWPGRPSIACSTRRPSPCCSRSCTADCGS